MERVAALAAFGKGLGEQVLKAGSSISALLSGRPRLDNLLIFTEMVYNGHLVISHVQSVESWRFKIERSF